MDLQEHLGQSPKTVVAAAARADAKDSGEFAFSPFCFPSAYLIEDSCRLTSTLHTPHPWRYCQGMGCNMLQLISLSRRAGC